MFFRFNARRMPVITHMNRNVTSEGWKHFGRTADEYILYLVNAGCMYLMENGVRYELMTGDVLLLQPGFQHAGYREAFCDYSYVHFDLDTFEPFDCSEQAEVERILAENRSLLYTCNPFGADLYERTQLFIPKRLHVGDLAIRSRVERLVGDAARAFEGKEDHYKLVCSCKAVETLACLSSVFADGQLVSGKSASTLVRDNGKVQRVLDLLHAQYAEKLSGDSIAARLGPNFDYLNRVFKRQTGLTIFEYLNRVRINKAKELLINGNLKSAEIAAAVGFCDEYRFSKAFKKLVGVPPRKYH